MQFLKNNMFNQWMNSCISIFVRLVSNFKLYAYFPCFQTKFQYQMCFNSQYLHWIEGEKNHVWAMQLANLCHLLPLHINSLIDLHLYRIPAMHSSKPANGYSAYTIWVHKLYCNKTCKKPSKLIHRLQSQHHKLVTLRK